MIFMNSHRNEPGKTLPLKRLSLFMMIILGGFSGVVSAESGRPDYDLDDDGLIEINDLGDLDEIRNDTTGSTLYTSNDGCPVDGCFGFELTTDLDFDTNGDGEMDENDDYWNGGTGWLPIGNADLDDPLAGNNAFAAIFEGNDYTIYNLYIRSKGDNTLQAMGFIGQSQAVDADAEEPSYIQNVHFHGPLTSVSGNYVTGTLLGNATGTIVTNVSVDSYVNSPGGPIGGLIGYAQVVEVSGAQVMGVVNGGSNTGGLMGIGEDVRILDSFTMNQIFGNESVGGIIGYASDNIEISTSFSAGDIRGDDDVGGIMGHLAGTGGIADSYALGDIDGEDAVGGILGFSEKDLTMGRTYHSGELTGESWLGGIVGYIFGADNAVNISYWSSGLEDSVGFDETGGTNTDGNAGATEDELRCPVGPDEVLCLLGFPLYYEWPEDTWDFGTNKQLPALIIDGVVYRDTDEDGIWDFEDDSDGDGVFDDEDALPNDPDRSEPNIEGEVTISGTAAEGQVLTATVTDEDGLSDPDIYYLWVADQEPVWEGSNIYIPQEADIGKTIQVYVEYTDDAGFDERILSTETEEVISIEDNSWNRILAYANGGNAEAPYTEDYVIVGVDAVEPEPLAYLTTIMNYAVSQSAVDQVDELSELDALLDVILAGQDTDGDGLPDNFETDADIDGDGIPNFEDEDSDGEQIPDYLELGLDLTDSDLDGIIDVFDADADADGILDTQEKYPEIPADRVDDNLDGVDDNLATQAAFIAMFPEADADNDGLINPYDADSDGDGVNDLDDSNTSQENDVTAGGGAMGMTFFALMAGLLVALRRNHLSSKTLKALLAPLAMCLAVQAHAEFAVSAAMGPSYFNPETSDEVTVNDKTGVALQIDGGFAAYDEQVGVFVGITDLGAMKVNGGEVNFRSIAGYLQLKPSFLRFGDWGLMGRAGSNKLMLTAKDGLKASDYEGNLPYYAVGLHTTVGAERRVEILIHSFSEDARVATIGYRHLF